MSIDSPAEPLDDPATLVAAVLAEEARREAEQAERSDGAVLPDDLLPGVGRAAMPLREVLRRGGTTTVLLLSVVNMFEYFDRAAIQVLAPDIQRSLHISDAALGALAAMAGLFFVLGAIPLGFLADRTRRTLLASVCSVGFAVFQFVTGLVTAAWQLAITRVGTGLGQANIVPVHNALIADTYPIEGRARAFSLHGASGPAGRCHSTRMAVNSRRSSSGSRSRSSVSRDAVVTSSKRCWARSSTKPTTHRCRSQPRSHG